MVCKSAFAVNCCYNCCTGIIHISCCDSDGANVKCSEVEGAQTLRLDAGWKVENMRVVVLAIDSNRRIVVNCNVCKLGESVDYVVE